jgi:hypothetical protein
MNVRRLGTKPTLRHVWKWKEHLVYMCANRKNPQSPAHHLDSERPRTQVILPLFLSNISPVTIVVIRKKIMYKLRASENGAMRRISVHKKEEVTRR